jgi:hypothetical protein
MPRCFLKIGNFLSLLSIFAKIWYFIARTFFKRVHSTAFLCTEDFQLLDTEYSLVSYFEKLANRAPCKSQFVFWCTVLRLCQFTLKYQLNHEQKRHCRSSSFFFVHFPTPSDFLVTKKKLQIIFIFPLWLKAQHFFFFWCGVRLSPLGTSVTMCPNVPAPDQSWWWVFVEK